MHVDDRTVTAFGAYRIDRAERTLYYDGTPVALAPKVVDTLLAFFAKPGRVIAKATLMEAIWPNAFVDEANLTQNIYVLRRLFEEHGSGLRIENVPKRGYRLVGTEPHVPATPITVATPAPSAAPAPAAPAPRALGRGALPIALALATAVVVAIAFGSRTVPAGAPTPTGLARLSSDALQNEMLGRYYLALGTAAGLERGRRAFERVVDAAPASALGYAGLADIDVSATFRTNDGAERARLGARAIALARQAATLEPQSADAFAALGAADAFVAHDDAAAASAFATALRLNRNNLDALEWDGTSLMNQGRVEEARRLFERAMSVDPSAPGPMASLAWSDFLAHDYWRAIAFSRQLLREHRLEALALLTLANAEVAAGRYGAAATDVDALTKRAGMGLQAAALRAQLAAVRGETTRAADTLARLETSADPSAASEWDIIAIGAAYARLHRVDDALVWLDRLELSARRQLARDPRFDAIRGDARFRAWLRA